MHAPSLLDAQRAMVAALQSPGADARLETLLIGAVDAMPLHRWTCQATLHKALVVTFPAVCALLGERGFDAACAQFSATRPARDARLDDYGATFAQFLVSAPLAGVPAYLPDVARVEYAISRAIHAPAAVVLRAEQLLQLPARWTDARLAVHPGVSVLALNWPADRLWSAAISKQAAAVTRGTVRRQRVRVLVERDLNGVPVCVRCGAAGWPVTRALWSGATLGEALATAPGAIAQRVLAGHLAAGRFVSDGNSSQNTGDA